MVEAIFDWMAEHFGSTGRHVSIEIPMDEDFSYEDGGSAQISFGDAMSCAHCQAFDSGNSVPSGKQVF